MADSFHSSMVKLIGFSDAPRLPTSYVDDMMSEEGLSHCCVTLVNDGPATATPPHHHTMPHRLSKGGRLFFAPFLLLRFVLATVGPGASGHVDTAHWSLLAQRTAHLRRGAHTASQPAHTWHMAQPRAGAAPQAGQPQPPTRTTYPPSSLSCKCRLQLQPPAQSGVTCDMPSPVMSGANLRPEIDSASSIYSSGRHQFYPNRCWAYVLQSYACVHI
jgi:hypothetical protein